MRLSAALLGDIIKALLGAIKALLGAAKALLGSYRLAFGRISFRV